MAKLNSLEYKINIYTYNSEIPGGRTLSNLIQNSNFKSNTTESWGSYGAMTLRSEPNINGKSAVQLISNGPNSYMYQFVPIVANNKYYFSFEYIKNNDSNISTFIEEGSPLIISERSNVWKRVSYDYTSSITGSFTNFTVGKSPNTYNNTYFTNFMLINLTNHYKGYEPKKEWLDQNIDYFEGTMSYYIEKNIKEKDNRTIQLVSNAGYRTPNPVCTSKNGKWIPASNISIKYDPSNGNCSTEKCKSYLTLNNINDDITCTIKFS